MITLGEMAVDLKKKADNVNQKELGRLRLLPRPSLQNFLSTAYSVMLFLVSAAVACAYVFLFTAFWAIIVASKALWKRRDLTNASQKEIKKVATMPTISVKHRPCLRKKITTTFYCGAGSSHHPMENASATPPVMRKRTPRQPESNYRLVDMSQPTPTRR